MVKRSINLRLLIATVLGGAALAGGIYGLHAWQITRTAQGLQVLAQAQEQKSEWLKAANFLDRYLRLRPDDAPAAGRLALTYAKGAKSEPERRRAVSLHYRALALDQGSQAAEIRAGLADLLLELGRLTEAENEARKLLDKDPNDPRAARVLALALAAQWSDGSLARANLKQLAILGALEQARATNPSDPRVAMALATVLRESTELVAAELPQLTLLDRQQRADATMDQLVRDNPQDGTIYLARYAYRLKYSLPEADRDLQEAVRLAPDNTEVLLTAGAAALDTGRRLKAESAAQTSTNRPGDDKTPADKTAADRATIELQRAQGFFQKLVAKPAAERVAAAYLGLGDAQATLGEREAADRTWRDGLKHFRQPTVQIALYAKIAESLLEANRPDEAGQPLDEIQKLVERLGTSVPRDLRIAFVRERDLRRARWHVQRGELAPAIPLLRSVALRQPQGDPRIDTTLQAQFLLGSIQYRLGEWVEAATAYDEAARLSPALHQARLAAARAYLMAGRPRLAAERAEQALATAKTVDAWLVLASAEFQEQASAPPASRNWRRLLEALDILEQVKPELADNAPWRIDFLRVDYLMAEARSASPVGGVPAEVAAILSQAEAAYADHKDFWLQVCLAYQNLGLLPDAERALAELKRIGGAPVAVAVAESRLASQRGDHAAAEKILEDAAKTVSVDERVALRNELLRVALAVNDLPKARAILLEENRRQPGDLSVIRRLAELDLEQRDFAAVEKWAQEAAKEANGSPGKLLAQYLLAWRSYLTAAAGADASLKPALAAVDQVVLARPGWAEAVSLKGLIELRLGQREAAAADLERAVNLGQRRLFVFEQLIALLESQQRWSDVEVYLSRLAAELPKSQGLAEAAANFELYRQQPEDAVRIARESLAQRPDDPRAHLWLGRMLLVTGAFDEAESALEKAVELGPGDAGTWSGLLSLHTRTRERPKAEKVLARLAANTAVDAIQKGLLLAQGYEAIGQQEQARREFSDLAGRTATDINMQLRVAQFHLKSDPREAERILRQVLARDKNSDAARRLLALAVASQGEKGLEEAQALLTQAGADGTVASDDQRIRAILLVQQGGLANLNRAVQIVEGLIAGQAAAAPGDRQLLAQLYERQALVMDDPAQIDAKVRAAQSHWEEAAGAGDAPPASLAAIVQFFVRHNRKAEALPWLDKLETAVDAQPKRTSELIALVVQMQMLAGVSDRSEKWLAGLDKTGIAGGLRALVLEARVAAERDPAADVEPLVESRAAELESAAVKPADQATLFAAVGDLYTAVKNHAAAERWYRRLLAIAPEQFPLLVGALTRQGRLADAIAVCGEAARAEATTRPAMVLTAALTESQPTEQDFKQAGPIIEAAVARFPSDTGLLYAVTLVDLLQGKYDEAIKHYRQLLTANPAHVPALNNLAMLLAERPAERAEAIRLIDKAIEIVGKDPGLMDTKGAILVYSSRPAEALPLLVSATRGENADPRHYFHLSVAYRDLGQLDQAKAQFQIALGKNLDRQLLMPIDQRLLAELREQLGQ
jgi:tetratricopeptide (TPR) repeat protein